MIDPIEARPAVILGPGFKVRLAGEQQLTEILAVYRECEDFLALGPVAQASTDMVRQDLRLSHDQGGLFCGIYAPGGGPMMGVLDFVPHDYAGEPTFAFIELLMIAAPYRGRGLGASVVDALERELREEGRVRAILAGVQVNNPGAIRFWQRQGFKITSGPQLMPDQTIAYDLRKNL